MGKLYKVADMECIDALIQCFSGPEEFTRFMESLSAFSAMKLNSDTNAGDHKYDFQRWKQDVGVNLFIFCDIIRENMELIQQLISNVKYKTLNREDLPDALDFPAEELDERFPIREYEEEDKDYEEDFDEDEEE